MKFRIERKPKINNVTAISANEASIDSSTHFKDNREETLQLKKIQGIVKTLNPTIQFAGGDHYYWYRTAAGNWTLAGKFKSHPEATKWIKENKGPLNIIDFGEGGKSSHR